MKTLRLRNKNFYNDLEFMLKSRSQNNLAEIDESVKNIIAEVMENGDKALFKFVKKFENNNIDSSNFLISKDIRNSYKNQINSKTWNSFKIAIENITKFHQKQKPENYEMIESGTKISSLWKPIQSVGLYVPGGKAVYPSSLIMNLVPAKVAGVERIVVVTPNVGGKINPYLLAILDEFNIDEIYQLGGAHAIAALAYGTENIKPVNKIVGPGNAYIASAKKQVFGKVGIDLIAGPSEIVVVADKNNRAEWVASDLIAQAEHDEKAQSILITNDEGFSNKVLLSIETLSNLLPKKKIIKESLNNYGIIIIVDNFENVHKIINFIAPEHLHLQNETKEKILKGVNNAGGIFLGDYSTEAFGDYIIGTNHILPTYGSAKFSSGLGVLDFMKRSSLVEMNFLGFQKYKNDVSRIADVESLEGHKLSVKIRQTDKK